MTHRLHLNVEFQAAEIFKKLKQILFFCRVIILGEIQSQSFPGARALHTSQGITLKI